MNRYEIQIKMQGDKRFYPVPKYMIEKSESNDFVKLMNGFTLLADKIEKIKDEKNKLHNSQLRMVDNCDMKPCLTFKPLINRC